MDRSGAGRASTSSATAPVPGPSVAEPVEALRGRSASQSTMVLSRNRINASTMKTFTESERLCEASFLSGGHFWHAYTSGKETPLLFAADDDFRLAMNIIAQSSAAYPQVRILAFEVMDNHFHFAVSAPDEFELRKFWNFVRWRLVRLYPNAKALRMSAKAINNLQSLRNVIVYVNRNGYVADRRYTPFSYPWGTGRYYYIEAPIGKELKDVFTVEKRAMFRSRAPVLPETWRVTDGYVLPTSYCAIDYGMAMFRDAHHYFSMLCKNVEGYAEVAVELDDSEFLTDSELNSQLMSILRAEYRSASLRDLSKTQKFDLARRLRQSFHSSNGQIRRVLGLSSYEIDSLFPLSAAAR